MSVATGTIETILRDIRRWINDRHSNNAYSNDELLRAAARSHDTVIEDIFTTPEDKPFMQFDLPIVADKSEYLLPTGIGHIYSLALLVDPPSAADRGALSQLVSAIIPAFKQDDIRWPGWLWNPPFLRFSRVPTVPTTVRITFIPRAIDYIHLGSIGVSSIKDPSMANRFTLTFEGNEDVELGWNGSQTQVNATFDAATMKIALDSLTGITAVTVTGSVGGPYTVTFSNPSGYQPLPYVKVPPISGSCTIAAVYTDTYPQVEETTIALSANPTIGQLDPRPNAYIGGRIRLLEGIAPSIYRGFWWMERDIIEHDPSTGELTLSSPLDFVPWGPIKYEIIPMSEPCMLYAAAVDTARSIHTMAGNRERVAHLEREYNRALTTARRLLGTRNKALSLMPTPTRYLRDNSRYSSTAPINNVTSQILDRFNV